MSTQMTDEQHLDKPRTSNKIHPNCLDIKEKNNNFYVYRMFAAIAIRLHCEWTHTFTYNIGI